MQPIDLENSKYSLGTTPIYNTLLKEITKRNAPVEVVLFNVSTILRNCNSKESVKQLVDEDKRLGRETDRPSQMLLSETKREINLLLEDILEMFRYNTNILNPTLIAYFCNYQKTIPTTSYREPTHGKRVLTTAETMLLHSMRPGNRAVKKAQNVTLVEVPITRGKFPHAILAEEIGFITNNHRIAHITHHPVDYHVCKYTSDYRLIQSFTGQIIRPNELGDKVFSNSSVPFNVYTHAVLGDSVDIKSSITPSTKKKLIQVAQQEHWKEVHTSDWIRDRLKEIGIRIPFEIKGL